ncbi:MAG: hypothetical protein ACOC8N_09650 [Spirochaetota bacterium]
MSCEAYREEISRWLEQALASPGRRPAVPGVLERHAASCARCRSVLQAAVMLAQGTSLRRTPPPWVAARIREAVHRAAGRGEPLFKKLFRERLTNGRVVVPAAAFAGVVLAAAVLFFAYFERGGRDQVTVRLFLEAPRASAVSVVGDWNGWDPSAHRLFDRDGDGVWEIEIHLEPDREYRYQFLIDGERWIPDPNAPFKVDDGFGGTNSVLHI